MQDFHKLLGFNKNKSGANIVEEKIQKMNSEEITKIIPRNNSVVSTIDVTASSQNKVSQLRKQSNSEAKRI